MRSKDRHSAAAVSLIKSGLEKHLCAALEGLRIVKYIIHVPKRAAVETMEEMLQ